MAHSGGRDERFPENITDPNFYNTCAVRLSLALLGAGFPNPGVYPIQAGKYKGRSVETRQRKLSDWLARQLGQPEKYNNGSDAENKVDNRHGIVSFFHIYGDERNQSHISIVSIDRWGRYLRCGNEIDGTATGCYWSSNEVWFWPLK